ncbi:MAG: CDP-alcohol phosphatidyltransferase family protein [Actinomycetota bacterium]
MTTEPTTTGVDAGDARGSGLAPAEGVFDRVWTLPNLFTLVRLFCLPLFLWLLFSRDDPARAAWLLVLLGSTDWVDGWLARRLDQTSEFGKVFDPTVDRLLFIVSVTAIIVDDRIPLWFALAVLVRELLVGGVMTVATLFFGMERFGVTWWGKTATFLLMGAIPSFLLSTAGVWESDAFGVVAWVVGIPGLVLSWYTAIAYIPHVRDGLRTGRSNRAQTLDLDVTETP